MSESSNTGSTVLSHSTPITIALLMALLSIAFFAGVMSNRLGNVESKAAVADARSQRIEDAIDLLKEVSVDNKRRLDEIERSRERERGR